MPAHKWKGRWDTEWREEVVAMYVGPWQEYKLMRVLADVKAENTRLKQSLHGSQHHPDSSASSVASTPKSYASAPAVGGSSIGVSRPARLPIRNVRRGQSGAHLPSSRPDSAKPESVTSTRSAPIVPTLFQSGSASNPSGASALFSMDDRLRNTFMMLDSDFITSHPLVSDLIRGGPMSTYDQSTLAGQRTAFNAVQPAAIGGGKKSEEELAEERAKRRVYLSMLYSGQAPPEPAPPGGASNSVPDAVGQLVGVSAQRGANDRNATRPQLAVPVKREISSGARLVQPLQQPVPQHEHGSILNRNVVRDLAAFYDMHLQQQPVPLDAHRHEFQLPRTIVPWDVQLFPASAGPPTSSNAALYQATIAKGPQQLALSSVPAPLNVSQLMSQRSNTSGAPSVSSVTTRDSSTLDAMLKTFDDGQRFAGACGAGDAQQFYLKQRPYDFGGPPASDMLPQSTARPIANPALVSSRASNTISVGASDEVLLGSSTDVLSSPTRQQRRTPIRGRRVAGGSSDLQLPQRTAAAAPASLGGTAVNRLANPFASTEGLAQLLSSGQQHNSPIRASAGLLATNVGKAGRPTSVSSATGSLDGDEMAELLSWANNLNPRDSFGI